MTNNNFGYMCSPFSKRICQVERLEDNVFPVYDGVKEAREALVDRAYKEYDDARKDYEEERVEYNSLPFLKKLRAFLFGGWNKQIRYSYYQKQKEMELYEELYRINNLQVVYLEEKE